MVERPKDAFKLKLSPTLVSLLLVEGVKPDTFIEFVAAQFQNIVACKPNCRIHTQPDKPVWVLRGYYPGTPVFFKITVVKAGKYTNYMGDEIESTFSYHVRARELKVGTRVKWNKILNIQGSEIVVMSKDIFSNITIAMENSLLGLNQEVKPLINGGPVKPKCMSPKGMKLFKLKKAKKK